MVVVDQTLPDVSIRGLFDLDQIVQQKGIVGCVIQKFTNNIESAEQIHLANKQIPKDENAVRNLTELIRIHLYPSGFYLGLILPLFRGIGDLTP